MDEMVKEVKQKMSIQDFLEEAKKKSIQHGGMSPAEPDVHDFGLEIYHRLNGGDTSRWVKEAAKMLTKNIAPGLSSVDTDEVIMSIEAIALTVLVEFLSSDTLIKTEVSK